MLQFTVERMYKVPYWMAAVTHSEPDQKASWTGRCAAKRVRMVGMLRLICRTNYGFWVAAEVRSAVSTVNPPFGWFPRRWLGRPINVMSKALPIVLSQIVRRLTSEACLCTQELRTQRLPPPTTKQMVQDLAKVLKIVGKVILWNISGTSIMVIMLHCLNESFGIDHEHEYISMTFPWGVSSTFAILFRKDPFKRFISLLSSSMNSLITRLKTLYYGVFFLVSKLLWEDWAVLVECSSHFPKNGQYSHPFNLSHGMAFALQMQSMEKWHRSCSPIQEAVYFGLSRFTHLSVFRKGFIHYYIRLRSTYFPVFIL